MHAGRETVGLVCQSGKQGVDRSEGYIVSPRRLLGHACIAVGIVGLEIEILKKLPSQAHIQTNPAALPGRFHDSLIAYIYKLLIHIQIPAGSIQHHRRHRLPVNAQVGTPRLRNHILTVAHHYHTGIVAVKATATFGI